MVKVLISEYYFGFIVTKALPYNNTHVIGYERIHRGINIYGRCLGYYEKPIYENNQKYIEGEALSQAFKTRSEALKYANELNAEIIYPSP